MAIFQSSVLKKFLKQQDDAAVAKAYKKFTKYFHNPKIQENIREIKEEGFQQKFLMELFVTVFNYTINPDPKYNLTTEYKNLKGAKKADGAVLQDGKALAVIELKSTKTKDLESIRQQAFDYKANQPGCVYVITSNFEKLRFYINKSYEFEEFDLFSLSEDEFKLMYLCLQKDNLLKNVPLKIKEASILEEEAITKKFYADYSLFKRELYRDLVKRNMRNDVFRNVLAAEESVSKADKNIKLTLFKKSQKLLDRFLFLFFGEDRGLLPPNSVPKILEQWEKLKELDEYVPLYDRYKKYFNYLNEGWKGKDYEIFAYNGGLFKPDAILDSIVIDDDLLFRHTSILTKYDFESQVDVNILGHIFENSLNEIESVNAEIEGVDFDKQKTKRKKDGVFYTPKYITKYIVDNTIGKLCEEKKLELNITDDRFANAKKRSRKGVQDLDAYRDWLLQLTICDPACGSGAFLNQALEFLITEHKYLDELQAKYHGGFAFPDVENSILENNIYGVDLNEESVEIAKLSLWLRTAQKGRKLTSLNNNIKCGNSLIESKSVAGEKAFNWESEFPEVFNSGGFDIIIGNPPYVRHELLLDFKEIFAKTYSSFQSTADLYVYFIEKGMALLKEHGILGYITPSKFIQVTYGAKLRKLIGASYSIKKLIDFGELPVFEDAATFPFISIIENSPPQDSTRFVKINSLRNLDIQTALDHDGIDVQKSSFLKENWNLISQAESNALGKINEVGKPLKDYLTVSFYRGILTGFNEAFIIDESKRSELIRKDSRSSELIKPFVDGDDVRRYHLRSKNKYLIFTRRGTDIEKYPAIKEHLLKYYDRLLPKKSKTDKIGRKSGDYNWYEIQDSIAYYEEFDKPKIIYPEIAKESRFSLDLEKTYLNKTIFFIPVEDYYLLALLNSKLIWFYLCNTCTSLGDPKNGGRLNIQKVYLEKTPIVESPDKEVKVSLENKSKKQLTRYTALHSLQNKFINYLQSTYSVEKVNTKLQWWYKLEYSEFIKELNKAIKKSGADKLSKTDEMEWMDLFESKKKEATDLKSVIDNTDAEIDEMIYALYGLNRDEIEVVESY